MPWTLISLTQCPPGEFIFPKPAGSAERFWKSPLANSVAASMADYRRGNNLPRPSVQECLEDVIAYTCQRLGNMREYCINTDQGPAQSAALNIPKAGCGGCGAKL